MIENVKVPLKETLNGKNIYMWADYYYYVAVFIVINL